MVWGGASSQAMSFTTWTALYFFAASWQASTVSSQVGSRPVSTTHPPEQEACTASPKRADSRLLIFRSPISMHPFALVSRSADLLFAAIIPDCPPVVNRLFRGGHKKTGACGQAPAQVV